MTEDWRIPALGQGIDTLGRLQRQNWVNCSSCGKPLQPSTRYVVSTFQGEPCVLDMKNTSGIPEVVARCGTRYHAEHVATALNASAASGDPVAHETTPPTAASEQEER